uniref:Centromere protein R n=1 Tax=Geotrypetes seraphini TaxID=260995 RepID=A0A6P8PC64_GEOSA|nr:centromere protein R [Geotrypetes seraphini]XP_033773115.1 centromere protein R [Geotrypetes seraphini]XP_033773116.1 centromere protein R [Geotrypetes seraphini]
MSVKRSLKLDAAENKNEYDTTPWKKKKEWNQHFSPTTGTCKISSSPCPNEKGNTLRFRKQASNAVYVEPAVSSRGQLQTEEDNFMTLLSKVEKSLGKFVKMRENLKHIQTLEGSRELENVIGTSDAFRNLKAELQKTKELVAEVEKRKQLHSAGQHSSPDYCPPISSYEFLISIIH